MRQFIQLKRLNKNWLIVYLFVKVFLSQILLAQSLLWNIAIIGKESVGMSTYFSSSSFIFYLIITSVSYSRYLFYQFLYTAGPLCRLWYAFLPIPCVDRFHVRIYLAGGVSYLVRGDLFNRWSIYSLHLVYIF